MSQLRSAAAALTPTPEGPDGDEKPNDQPTSESQAEEGEEEEEAAGEQRAQALRALLLARKRKNHTSDHTGGLKCLK